MSLFPLIDAPDTGTAQSLPPAREVAWDFVLDQPIWRSGSPLYVTGADAVLVGETLMRSPDKKAKLAELRSAL